MWPFGRKQADEDSRVPSEIQDYYQAEQRERMGVAWLLASVTLVGTVLVVLGLFFGGRALYHKFQHNPKPVATVTQPLPATTPAPKATAPATQPKSTNSHGSNTSGTATGGTVAAPGPSVTSAPTQGKSGAQQAITNTGPGDIVSVFALAAIAGFIGYEFRLRRKLN